MSMIVLCPGQGAQQVGMGRSWFDGHTAARETLQAADGVCGFELSRVCFDGPADRLNRTDIAQAAIYAVSVASYRALAAEGALDEVTATAGLSLGEFTALHLSGAFDFEAGLRLVLLRGQAMQQAAESSPGGMVALVGATEQQATELCEAAVGDGVLVPANYNCPGQVVVSGTKDACERAAVVAEKMGLRASVLQVAGAFHSPLMQPAADRLAEALDQTEIKAPAMPVVSNVTAEPHGQDPTTIKQLLVQQVTSPVRWDQSMRWVVQNLSGDLIELAPGKVLTGLMRRIDRGTKVRSFAEAVA